MLTLCLVRLNLVIDFPGTEFFQFGITGSKFSTIFLCFLAAEIAWHQMRKEWVGNRSKKLERPPKDSIVRYMHISDFICYKKGEERKAI